MRRFVPEKAKVIPQNATRVFQGEIFNVYQWPQEMFDGTTRTFEMLKRSDTVEIMTLLGPEEQDCLVRSWQVNGMPDERMPDLSIREPRILITHQIQPCQDWFYAYPGGRVDGDDADELKAAKRELKEETGVICEGWKLLEAHQPFAKADWLVYTFLATGLKGVDKLELDGGEKIKLLLLSFDELRDYAKKPNAKFLWPAWLDRMSSFKELMDLPGIFNYN